MQPRGTDPSAPLAPPVGRMPWGILIIAGGFFVVVMAVLGEMARAEWLTGGLGFGSIAFTTLHILVVAGFLLAVTVVTFRDQLNLAEAARSRLQRIADANLVGIAIIGEGGKILKANDEFLRILGRPAGALSTGTAFWSALAAGDGDGRMLQRAWEHGTAPQTELTIRRDDGSQVPVIAGLAAVPGPSRELVAAVLDISDQKRVEETLARQAAELTRSNEELERFAYVASHDLQEPLRMVTSYVQLLERRYKGRLDEDADEFIRYAVDGARRMQSLIQDLLAYSRIGTARAPARPTATEEVLQRALENLTVAIRERDARITHDPLPSVTGDAKQLTQLFQNLVSNALKFTPSEREPRIHVTARRRGDEWSFAVIDNGIGIAPEYGDRIFVIFQRLHDRESYPGTGIGLAICKKIVEGHGGRIWYESRPGEGATFHFTLSAPKEEARALEAEAPEAEDEEGLLVGRARKLI